jgi:dephospho-CoA kinase
MRVLGLTGGIGSGKSTVAARLAELGARVVDADALAREAVAPGAPALDAIRRRFGDGVLGPDGGLDRRALGRVVFEDPEARRDLEAIVHPRVAELAAARIEAARAEGAPLAVYDVPLLYESGLDRSLPEVCVVWASWPARKARIAARDDLDEDEIEARMRAQMPLEDKRARADHVIDNDGDRAACRRQVDALYATLTKEAPP